MYMLDIPEWTYFGIVMTVWTRRKINAKYVYHWQWKIVIEIMYKVESNTKISSWTRTTVKPVQTTTFLRQPMMSPPKQIPI